MKFKDVTLDDIKEYFDNNDCGLIYANYDEEYNPSILNIFRFNDDINIKSVYICGIYKDNNDDIIVKIGGMNIPLNFGYEDDIMDNDDVPIEIIINIILDYVKVGICENIESQKEQIEFINDFGKQCGLEIASITTSAGNEYE